MFGQKKKNKWNQTNGFDSGYWTFMKICFLAFGRVKKKCTYKESLLDVVEGI